MPIFSSLKDFFRFQNYARATIPTFTKYGCETIVEIHNGVSQSPTKCRGRRLSCEGKTLCRACDKIHQAQHSMSAQYVLVVKLFCAPQTHSVVDLTIVYGLQTLLETLWQILNTPLS